MSVLRRTFETSDIDEAVEVFRAAFTGGGLRLSEQHDFRYMQRFAGTAVLGAVQQTVAARLESRSDESETLFVAWTDEGSTSYRMGGRVLQADAGLLWSGRKPVEATVLHADIGSITVDRTEFEARARLLLHRDEFVLPDFAPLPSAEHVQLVRAHAAHLQQHQLVDPVMENPLLARTVTDLTVAVVLAAGGLAGPGEDRAAAPAAVRRALAFIDDNLHRPIAAADIAAAAGLSERGLHAAFRRDVGESPMQRLRRARLTRARQDLQASDPAVESVAGIARRWGFLHLGRFAEEYRAVYGEAPSATLRR